MAAKPALQASTRRPRRIAALRYWFDTGVDDGGAGPDGADRIDWLRAAPFIGMHLACAAARLIASNSGEGSSPVKLPIRAGS